MIANWTPLLQQLLDGQALSPDQTRSLMTGWLEATIAPEVSGALLVAFQVKGITASELAAMAEVLYQSSAPSTSPRPNVLLDTCGTGGDGKDTFNISTSVAFVAAAAGIPVAKHGNRAVSSRSGSADVLEALGINLNAPLGQMEAAVEAVGITFLFAPYWHPAMKAVASLRRNLGIRTVFNLLGPLVNPLRPSAQVLGVYRQDLIAPMAGALRLLGVGQGVVLHSREGLDEVGLGDVTDLMWVNDDGMEVEALDPQSVGIGPMPLECLHGGNVAENAEIMAQVLQGKGTLAQTQCVALNSALALRIAGIADTWTTGYDRALTVLRSGAAWDKLRQLQKFLASDA